MTLPSWVPRSRPGPVHLHRTSSWRDDSPLSQPRPASRVPRPAPGGGEQERERVSVANSGTEAVVVSTV